MRDPNIFVYSQYREYLRDFLKYRSLSYRQFALEYKGVISFNALARLLTKGRSGNRQRGDYNISTDGLLRLGRAMGMKPSELRFLLLLKMNNDAIDLKPPFGNTQKRITGEWLEDLYFDTTDSRSKLKIIQDDRSLTGRASLESSLMQNLFERLSERAKSQIIDEVLTIARADASRRKGKPGLKKMEKLIVDITTLSSG